MPNRTQDPIHPHLGRDPRGLAVSRGGSAGHGHWTPALRARFLDRLSAWGDVRAAVASCGLSRQSVYKLRQRDAQFARDWDAALARLRKMLDEELLRRMRDNPRLAKLTLWTSSTV